MEMLGKTFFFSSLDSSSFVSRRHGKVQAGESFDCEPTILEESAKCAKRLQRLFIHSPRPIILIFGSTFHACSFRITLSYSCMARLLQVFASVRSQKKNGLRHIHALKLACSLRCSRPWQACLVLFRFPILSAVLSAPIFPRSLGTENTSNNY